jgi:ADP-heptose:LPS heptosyltransferase
MLSPAPDSNGLFAALRRWHARLWAGAAPAREARKFSAVVVKLDRIGDFVLAIGAIRLIGGRYGEENCALVIAPDVAELAAREFPQATLIVLPPFVRHKRAWPDWRRARRLLGGVTAGELFCLRHQRWDYHELVLSWIRADRRHVIEDPRAARWVKGRRSVRMPGIPVTAPATANDGLCGELRLHRALLAAAWNEPPPVTDILPTLRREEKEMRGDYAVIAPFTTSALKDLPAATLAAVLGRPEVVSERQLQLVGARAQRGRLMELAAMLRSTIGREIEVVTPASLTAFITLLGGARWVLTADSAAAHLATALDQSTVVLLGGGCPGHFAPWQRSPRQVWLEHELPCFDCGWRCTQPEPYCVTKIGPERVAHALAEVTGGGP